MAVFTAASDESAGKDRHDKFVFAGLIANEEDWSKIFAPAWHGLVLKGPPEIEYLHMTDIRSRKWREEQFLTEQDADERVDRAVKAIAAADFIFSIGLTVSGADICDAFANVKVKSPNRASSVFAPDYLCFLGYAMVSLDYVAREHPECEKLDFAVE